MSSNNESQNFVGGFLLGSLLGACLAALLAPYKGNDAQRNIFGLYQTGLVKAQDLQNQTKNSINELRETTQYKAKQLMNDLQVKAGDIANRFDHMTARGASILIDDEIT